MTLDDGMSAVLKKITCTLDVTLVSFEKMQQASSKAMDVSRIRATCGALADAGSSVDRMADHYCRATQEAGRLHQGIREGTSALADMVKKAFSLEKVYAHLSTVKEFAVDSMGAADAQINAQRKLRTALHNIGAEDDFNAFADETSRNTLGNTLALGATGAVGNDEALMDLAGPENTPALAAEGAIDGYTGLAGSVGGNMTLDTGPAQAAYAAFAAGVDGGRVSMEVQTDTGQATAAYDAILAKASEIQGAGIYGDEAMIAGAAEFATHFSDANAILSMMDTLTDYAMGMSGGGALDSKAMADYAANLGKVMSGSFDAMKDRGFTFSEGQKAIIEGTATEAQIVAELGAEYLAASADMQAAAAINAVIAGHWGGMYESMSSTPEGKLIQLNNTLGNIKENVGAGIYPAVIGFVDMIQANTPQIEAAAMGLASVLGFVIKLLTGMVAGAIAFGTAVADNWGWIGPIVMGAAAALGLYWSATKGVAIAQGIAAAATAGFQAVVNFLSIGFGVLTGNTAAASAAVFTFNSALMTSPITWVALSILALIAVIYAAVGAVNHFAGTSVSATGIIAGAFSVLGAYVLNKTVIPFYNRFAMLANFLGNVFSAPAAAVKVLFYDMVLEVIGYIANMAHAIESVINKIPGVTVDITSGLDNFYKGLETAQQAVKDENGWVEYVRKMDFIDYSDAASAGYGFGQGVENKIGGFFDGLGYELGTIEDFTDQGFNGLGYERGTNGDFTGQGFDGFMAEGLGNDVGTIADNTGNMAHALEVSGEELKYLRDIAERDAINRFTTAEVKIDMTGMTNRIDGSNDLDGVIRELTDGFSEALVTAAEGVHE